VKGHGLGNDYLVLDQSDLAYPLSRESVMRICDRNLGVGSDGILLLTPSDKADFGLRILNPDGSEAEKSGNGLRIFAKYLRDHGHTSKDIFKVETKGGIVECFCHSAGGRLNLVTVEMGKATFKPAEIPMMGSMEEAVAYPLDLGNGTVLVATSVSVGNPHCVIFMENVDQDSCRHLGPMIENHSLFPHRTNVQFAWPVNRNTIDILIWERGAGYTLASGSSSCGAASAAVRNGYCDPGRITVRMPGGELGVVVRSDWSLSLEGPVEETFTGALSDEFMLDYL
jgi:diaminopimelate epimerase